MTKLPICLLSGFLATSLFVSQPAMGFNMLEGLGKGIREVLGIEETNRRNADESANRSAHNDFNTVKGQYNQAKADLDRVQGQLQSLESHALALSNRILAYQDQKDGEISERIVLFEQLAQRSKEVTELLAKRAELVHKVTGAFYTLDQYASLQPCYLGEFCSRSEPLAVTWRKSLEDLVSSETGLAVSEVRTSTNQLLISSEQVAISALNVYGPLRATLANLDTQLKFPLQALYIREPGQTSAGFRLVPRTENFLPFSGIDQIPGLAIVYHLILNPGKSTEYRAKLRHQTHEIRQSIAALQAEIGKMQGHQAKLLSDIIPALVQQILAYKESLKVATDGLKALSSQIEPMHSDWENKLSGVDEALGGWLETEEKFGLNRDSYALLFGEGIQIAELILSREIQMQLQPEVQSDVVSSYEILLERAYAQKSNTVFQADLEVLQNGGEVIREIVALSQVAIAKPLDFTPIDDIVRDLGALAQQIQEIR